MSARWARLRELTGGRTAWPLIHLSTLIALALALPGGSLLFGNGEFGWTMFSKSETYRLTLTATDGNQRYALDPRALRPWVNPAVAYFLPAAQQWRHDPMGISFRTGLPYFASLACRLGAYQRIEAVLEERQHLDAPILATQVQVQCHR